MRAHALFDREKLCFCIILLSGVFDSTHFSSTHNRRRFCFRRRRRRRNRHRTASSIYIIVNYCYLSPSPSSLTCFISSIQRLLYIYILIFQLVIGFTFNSACRLLFSLTLCARLCAVILISMFIYLILVNAIFIIFVRIFT